jgi:hypothetical protein
MNRKLVAGDAFGHAISSVRNNLAAAFDLSWRWYIIIGITLLISTVIQYASMRNGNAIQFGTFTGLIAGLISLLAFSSIAVNWHRYILLDEMPHGSEYLRLDSLTMRYFGNLLLLFLFIFLIALVVVIPLALIGAATGSETFFMVLSVLIALPIAGIVFMRLGIKLPAIALAKEDVTFPVAWRLTDGNNGPVFLVFLFNVLVTFGVGIAFALIVFLINAISPGIALIIEFAGQLGLNWILSIFGITLLTSLYGFFAENRNF